MSYMLGWIQPLREHECNRIFIINLRLLPIKQAKFMNSPPQKLSTMFPRRKIQLAVISVDFFHRNLLIF